MRFSNFVLVLGFGGLSTLSALASGCGGGETNGSGGAGGGATGTSVSTSASTSTTSTGSAGATCASDDPTCTAVKSDCVALVDNKSQPQFALRMAHLAVTKPTALTAPTIKPLIEKGVVMSLEQCNLDGDGSFNLLMQFDTAAKTLKVGGAKPPAKATDGYAFATGVVKGSDISPVTVDATIGTDGAFSQSQGADIVLPIYIGGATDPTVLLPIKQAKISGTLSSDNNCVGKFDPTKLKDKVCTGAVGAYTDAANLEGHITLAQADDVVVDVLGQSLCVILSGDPTTFGDGGMPIKCKRTNGVIDFKGDWCTTGNKPADATCADSVQLTGTLSASSVKLNP
jgi:hypothetical protein